MRGFWQHWCRQCCLGVPIGLLVLVPVVHGQRGVVGVAGGGDADMALLRLWGQGPQATSDGEHVRHAEAWLGFAEGRPAGDGHAAVAHSLAGWHYLKAGRAGEARALFVRYAELDPAVGLLRAAREVSRGWLTCLDREAVVAVLALYRRDAVRYPERLAMLESWSGMPAGGPPPWQDRWGQPWIYRLERLRSMPMLEGQRYSLTSRALGELSDLRTALAVPYGENIGLRPVQIRSVPNRPPMVALAMAGSDAPPAMIQAGSQHEGVGVAHVSATLVILYDRLHWKLYPAPTR